MELVLKRRVLTPDSSIGDLFIKGIIACNTLEDAVRSVKIKGFTAIPYGRYEVIINYSNRFKQQMPLLLNVPNYEGVRIHWGNRSKDTDGCILVGVNKGEKDFIGHSRDTYARILNILQEASKKEKIFITITKYP